MKSERLIVAFDVESTSVDVSTARIVQMSLVFLDRELNVLSGPFSQLFNPEMPIPKEATEVHGITDDMVKDAPTFKDRCMDVFNALDPHDWMFYNGIRFDAGVLIEEFNRCGIHINAFGRQLIDPFQVFVKKEPRDLSAALKFYTGEEMVNAHDATADTMATVKIAKGQIEMYEDINSVDDIYSLIEPDNICDLAGKFKMKDGIPVFTFGKHIGQPISENTSFLRWMIDKDFPKDTKDFINRFLNENK